MTSAEIQVERFNRAVNVGGAVIARRETGELALTSTRAAAELFFGIPAVLVDGYTLPVALSALHPCSTPAPTIRHATPASPVCICTLDGTICASCGRKETAAK